MAAKTATEDKRAEAVKMAMAQIEKSHGKGSLMKLGDQVRVEIPGISTGALSFDLSEDSELWTDLAEAFQTIRDAVRQADILRDKKKVAAAQTRLKLVAARNDEGLQSLLRDAKGLRLVHSAPDDEQG